MSSAISFVYSLDQYYVSYRGNTLDNQFKTTPLPDTITVQFQNPSFLVQQYTYQLQGAFNECMWGHVYFELVNNVDPSNYQSYNLSMTLTFTKISPPPSGISGLQYYLISFLTVDQSKIAGPILSSLSFTGTSLTIPIGLLFPSYIIQSNKIFKVEFLLIPTVSTNHILFNSATTSHSGSYGDAPLPYLFSTVVDQGPISPLFSSPQQIIQPGTFNILARYQYQSAIGRSDQYPVKTVNVDFLPNNLSFPDLQYTTFFEAGVVFQTYQFLSTNDNNEIFALKINNLQKLTASASPTLVYVCTLTCLIQNRVMTSPVLQLKAIYDTSSGTYTIPSFSLTSYFPALQSSPSLLCFIQMRGWLRTCLVDSIPITFMSIYQQAKISNSGNPVKAINSLLPNASPSAYYYRRPSTDTKQSVTVLTLFPYNATCLIDGFAASPTLTVANGIVNNYLNIFTIQQSMNLVDNFRTNTVLGNSYSDAYYYPSTIRVCITFELLAPLNDIVESNSIILTLQNVGYNNYANLNYMVSATIRSESMQASCSQNFKYQLGSGTSKGFLYTLYHQKTPNAWQNSSLMNNVSWLQSYEGLQVFYGQGPLQVNNLLLLPVPLFNFSGSMPGHSIGDYGDAYRIATQWMGYLDVQNAYQWFGMGVRNADDRLVVFCYDAITDAQLFCWVYELNAPQMNFYQFRNPGLYPMTIQYLNTGGPAGLEGVVMGWFGDADTKLLTKAGFTSSALVNNSNFQNPSFPGIVPYNTATALTDFLLPTGDLSKGQYINRQYLYAGDIVYGSGNPVYEIPPPHEYWQPLPNYVNTPNITLDITNLFTQMEFFPGKVFTLEVDMTLIPNGNMTC